MQFLCNYLTKVSSFFSFIKLQMHFWPWKKVSLAAKKVEYLGLAGYFSCLLTPGSKKIYKHFTDLAGSPTTFKFQTLNFKCPIKLAQHHPIITGNKTFCQDFLASNSAVVSIRKRLGKCIIIHTNSSIKSLIFGVKKYTYLLWHSFLNQSMHKKKPCIVLKCRRILFLLFLPELNVLFIIP